jgi:hypothetical protein
VLAKGYLAKLLENNSVARYLKQSQADVLAESKRSCKPCRSISGGDDF